MTEYVTIPDVGTIRFTAPTDSVALGIGALVNSSYVSMIDHERWRYRAGGVEYDLPPCWHEPLRVEGGYDIAVHTRTGTTLEYLWRAP